MGTESDQYSTPVKQMLGVGRGLSRDGRSRRHARAQIEGAPRGLDAVWSAFWGDIDAVHVAPKER